MRVPAGHEGAAAGCADGVLDEGVAEGDGGGGDEAVEVGRTSGGVPEMTEDVGTPLVGVEDEDVGLGTHGDSPFERD
jgi:hypothetical protein